MRVLDRMNIRYEVREYEVDPDDLRAETVAAKVGMPPEQVFKTLVAAGDRNGVCLAVIPGNTQLDLKALAQQTGDRKIDTVPLKDVQPLTGYIRGGVTALVGIHPDDHGRRADRDLLARLCHTLPLREWSEADSPTLGPRQPSLELRPGQARTDTGRRTASPFRGDRVTTSVPSAPSEYEDCRSSTPPPNVTRRVTPRPQ